MNPLHKHPISLSPALIGHAQPLPVATAGISCGFPSPAEDYMEQALDLNQLLVRDKEATFFGRVKGDSMKDAHIYEGDVLVIDRSLQAKNGDIVLAMLHGEFTVKRLSLSREGCSLLPENPLYQPIILTPDMDFSIWGVITYVIHKSR